MSTNFYIRKKMNKEHHDVLIGMINNYEVENVEDFIHENFEKIHIGKRSCGWEFLWNFNDGKYYTSGKELLDLLKSGEYIMLDEYNRQYPTFEKFWEEISPWIKTDQDNPIDEHLLDLETYYKTKYSGEHIYYEKTTLIEKYKELYNIDVNDYGEFRSDDLRFSTSDFR